eukprot:m.182982 g.182982  ORF g.182982 m.182982 type:complete len:274 (+) comp15538_c0_seq4:223-1044(+)
MEISEEYYVLKTQNENMKEALTCLNVTLRTKEVEVCKLKEALAKRAAGENLTNVDNREKLELQEQIKALEAALRGIVRGEKALKSGRKDEENLKLRRENNVLKREIAVTQAASRMSPAIQNSSSYNINAPPAALLEFDHARSLLESYYHGDHPGAGKIMRVVQEMENATFRIGELLFVNFGARHMSGSVKAVSVDGNRSGLIKFSNLEPINGDIPAEKLGKFRYMQGLRKSFSHHQPEHIITPPRSSRSQGVQVSKRSIISRDDVNSALEYHR